jgi:hypothetical protein
VTRLDALGGVGGARARQAALVQVLGDVDVLCAAHAAGAELLRDGPVLRSLDRVRHDWAGLLRDLAEVSLPPPPASTHVPDDVTPATPEGGVVDPSAGAASRRAAIFDLLA